MRLLKKIDSLDYHVIGTKINRTYFNVLSLIYDNDSNIVIWSFSVPDHYCKAICYYMPLSVFEKLCHLINKDQSINIEYTSPTAYGDMPTIFVQLACDDNIQYHTRLKFECDTTIVKLDSDKTWYQAACGEEIKSIEILVSRHVNECCENEYDYIDFYSALSDFLESIQA